MNRALGQAGRPAPAPGATVGGLSLWGLALLVALTVIWGLVWPTMKMTVAEIPVFTFRAPCAVLAGAAVFGMCRLLGLPLGLSRRDRGPMLLTGLFNVFGWFYFSALGVTMIGAGRASIIAYTMPVWAFLVGIVVLQERPTRNGLIGLMLGMAGIAVLMGDDLIRLGQTPGGTLVMLGAAICFGTGAVLHKRFRWQAPTLTLIGWQLVSAAVPLSAAALIMDLDQLRPVSWGTVLGLLYVALIGSALGYYTWLRVVEMLPIRVASIGVLMIPLLGVVSSALALGEPVGWQEGVALALVMAAMATVMTMPRRAPPPG
ncbi:MAG: DMT family transporter [Kiloniellales bacterium]